MPGPSRRKLIPKAGKPGEFRLLGISTVKDSVVQCAIKQTMEPLFEAHFWHVSYGFAHRSCDRITAAMRIRMSDRKAGRPVFFLIRYADDFIVLTCGTFKETCKEKLALEEFLEDNAGLRSGETDDPKSHGVPDLLPPYIPMRKGFLYLVAIMDWASRKVLSWRLINTIDADCCVTALKEALAKYGKPAIFNTDQGSQFTSISSTQTLKDADVKISMGGRGRWVDKVMIERLWRTLKYDCVYLHAFETGNETRNVIGKWIRRLQ
jgi:hypothetical protein